jgi:hypothetical protein
MPNTSRQVPATAHTLSGWSSRLWRVPALSHPVEPAGDLAWRPQDHQIGPRRIPAGIGNEARPRLATPPQGPCPEVTAACTPAKCSDYTSRDVGVEDDHRVCPFEPWCSHVARTEIAAEDPRRLHHDAALPLGSFLCGRGTEIRSPVDPVELDRWKTGGVSETSAERGLSSSAPAEHHDSFHPVSLSAELLDRGTRALDHRSISPEPRRTLATP